MGIFQIAGTAKIATLTRGGDINPVATAESMPMMSLASGSAVKTAANLPAPSSIWNAQASSKATFQPDGTARSVTLTGNIPTSRVAFVASPQTTIRCG